MKTFLPEKNGYSKTEVNAYAFETEKQIEELNSKILKLETEKQILNDKLNYYKSNEDIISKSIQASIIAGEQIKQKNKQIYLNEITKIKNLYKKWETFLNNLSKDYPTSAVNNNSQLILKSLEKAIDEVLNEDNTNSNIINLTDIQKSFNKTQNYQKTIISGKNTGAKNEFKNVIVRNKKPSEQTIQEDIFEKEHKKEFQRLNLDNLENSLKNFNSNLDTKSQIEKLLNSTQKESLFSFNNKEIDFNKNFYNQNEDTNLIMDLQEIANLLDLE